MTINYPSTNSSHLGMSWVAWGERMRQSPRRVPAMEDAGAEEKDGPTEEFSAARDGWGKSLINHRKTIGKP